MTGQNKIFDPERIAYWFFRLNGCFILENFLVHHPQRGFEGTDIDILAARFPFRRELFSSEIPTTRPMIDHELFESYDGLINIYLVEVKRSRMRINPSWQNPERQNMERVLHAIGTFPENAVKDIATQLYFRHSYSDDTFRIRYVAVGEYGDKDLPNTLTTLNWQEILEFIYQRLYIYRNQKIQNRQWDYTGRRLYKLMQTNRGSDGEQQFINQVLDQMK